MRLNIFRVDWITIDTIIIILLILLLIGVKVLKEVYRWRLFFSNTSTIQRVDKHPYLNTQLSPIFIKKCTLTKTNVSPQENLIKPTIVIIRRYRKFMLLKALTEAFCSFGYAVINIQLKTIHNNETNRITSEVEQKFHQNISNLIKFYNHEAKILSQDYNIIEFSKKVIPFNFILKDSTCKNLILINPRLKFNDLEAIKTSIKDSNIYPQLITIYSEKLNPVLKNKKAIAILLNNETLKNTKHTVIQKAKSTFKYYETVLLSILIGYIEE